MTDKNLHINCFASLLLSAFVIVPFSVFAQSQPPCSGSVSITDATQAQPGVLAVVSNSSQASFTVTGPATYHGSGYYWVQQGISAGTYTVTWSDVAGCGTPSLETKTTNSQGSIAFAGNYQSTASQPTSTPKPTQTPAQSPPGHFMTIKSNPPSASVYINGSHIGTAPVKVQLPEGVPIQIKCTLAGYNDYQYNYPALGSLPAEVNSVSSDWTCMMIKKLVSPTSSLSPIKSYQPEQRPNKTFTPAPTPVPPSTYTPPSQQIESKGFFPRIFNSITSLFGNLFGRKNSNPTISNSPYTNSYNPPSNSSANGLQGIWKVEQIMMFDPRINDYRQIQANNYIEFKGNQTCPNGTFDLNGTPQPCSHYDTFTLSGDQIIADGNVPFIIHWKLTSGKLELAMDPKTGTSAQKQKITLSKIYKTVTNNSQSQNQPSVQPISNRPASTPVVTVIKTPLPKPIISSPPLPKSQPPLSIQDITGVWLIDFSANSTYGVTTAGYIQFRGNKICPDGLIDTPLEPIACPPQEVNPVGGAILGSFPFILSGNSDALFNFDGKQFIWHLSRSGTGFELTKNYSIDSKSIYGPPDTYGSTQVIDQQFYAKPVSQEKHILTRCNSNIVETVKKNTVGTYHDSYVAETESLVTNCKVLETNGTYGNTPPIQ